MFHCFFINFINTVFFINIVYRIQIINTRLIGWLLGCVLRDIRPCKLFNA